MSTVISILTAIGKFNVYATLITIGISVVGAVIDSYNTGTYKTQNIKDDLLVVVNNKLGLKTYQTTVNADVYSRTTGKRSREKIRSEGDGRTYSDMIHVGIYNVVALGW